MASAVSGILGGIAKAASPIMGGAIGISNAINNALGSQARPQQTPQQQIPTLANAAMQILGQQRGLMQNVPNQIAPINRVIQPMYNVLQAANPLSSLIGGNMQNANPLAQALMRLLGRQ